MFSVLYISAAEPGHAGLMPGRCPCEDRWTTSSTPLFCATCMSTFPAAILLA
jgi:hypothetical protein